MNRRNYQRELERIIEKNGDSRPRVLLHVCCGPCSSSVLEVLPKHFDLTLLWYNPNIYPEAEFTLRCETLHKLMRDMGLSDIPVISEPWQSERYYERVKGLENELEGGKRCTECFRLRLEETARIAAEKGFDWFCTTLTLSRHKDAVRINSIAEEIAQAIMEETERGATLADVRGAYTGKPHQLMMCVCSKVEVFASRRVINRIDPNAIVMLTTVDEAYGEGFMESEAD
jgi:predicted adenine nucleotide alpha hydrolase (AANH) superfamily ATPase